MTTRQTLLVERFAKTRRNLDEILDRISPDLMDWAPTAGMRTVSGQIAEIISVEIPLVPQLKEGRRVSDEEGYAMFGSPNDLASFRRSLVDVRKVTLDYLSSLSEEELLEEVSYGGAWFGSFWLPKLPRAELFLNIAEHEAYHVGQLISYFWARGDNPYDW